MNRCIEAGWCEVAREPKGPRGMWVRLSKGRVEICVGRSGDDDYASFDGPVAARLHSLFDSLLWTLEYK